jgi:hypothetical protein
MMRRGMLLSLLLAPFISQAKQQESKTIRTPEGAVSMTSKMVSPVLQEVVLLKAEKLEKIVELNKAAIQFLSAYNPGATPSLKTYDEAFRLWQRDHASPFSVDDVVERLGAYLGSRLAKDFDMEWVHVTDEYGTDLAVRARKYEVTSFPFSSVAKRIQNKQYDFMVGVYYAVQDAIASGPKER